MQKTERVISIGEQDFRPPHFTTDEEIRDALKILQGCIPIEWNGEDSKYELGISFLSKVTYIPDEKGEEYGKEAE